VHPLRDVDEADDAARAIAPRLGVPEEVALRRASMSHPP
jgi:hypothetical protein